jgi:hypothetical protein
MKNRLQNATCNSQNVIVCVKYENFFVGNIVLKKNLSHFLEISSPAGRNTCRKNMSQIGNHEN